MGVRMLARVLGTCDDGGGVMEDVVRGAGDVNLKRSGEPSFDMLAGAAGSESDAERNLGVSGPATSVVGISTSCDGWCSALWLSILPEAQAVQAMGDTLGCGARGGKSQSSGASVLTMRATVFPGDSKK